MTPWEVLLLTFNTWKKMNSEEIKWLPKVPHPRKLIEPNLTHTVWFQNPQSATCHKATHSYTALILNLAQSLNNHVIWWLAAIVRISASLQKLYVEPSPHNDNSISRRSLWKTINSWGWRPHEWIGALIKYVQQRSLSPDTMWDYSEKITICKKGSSTKHLTCQCLHLGQPSLQNGEK